MNRFEALLESRYSCRAFLSDSIAEQELATLFRMAQRAPSWCNVQPWQVSLVSGAILAELSAALLAAESSDTPQPDLPAPAAYEGVYRERRAETAYGLYGSLGIRREDRELRRAQARENFRFFGAPQVAVVTTEDVLGSYGVLDCGGYITTLLLAAESLGLAAVPQAAIAMYSQTVRRILDLPKNRLVVAAVALGYSDDRHPANRYRTSRASVSDVVVRIAT